MSGRALGVAVPSGLFPGQQLRPIYREPHPINPGALLSGIGAAVVWFGLFAGLPATSRAMRGGRSWPRSPRG
jgi:hypothetical protein